MDELFKIIPITEDEFKNIYNKIDTLNFQFSTFSKDLNDVQKHLISESEKNDEKINDLKLRLELVIDESKTTLDSLTKNTIETSHSLFLSFSQKLDEVKQDTKNSFLDIYSNIDRLKNDFNYLLSSLSELNKEINKCKNDLIERDNQDNIMTIHSIDTHNSMCDKIEQLFIANKKLENDIFILDRKKQNIEIKKPWYKKFFK
jgi:ElaB/YqjD/DUF883 family membrane-anchored ribosome-binding protein